MKNRLINSLIVTLLLFLAACSSLERQENQLYKNSTLNNLNPAPKSMSPQETDGQQTIDPVYLRSKADYHFTLGEALSLEGHSNRAIQEFKHALVYDPKSVTLRLRLAAEYVKSDLLSEAIKQAYEATLLEPENVNALLLTGGLYSSLKMYDKALAEYQKVLIIDPKNTDAQIYIGAIHADRGHYDQAIAHFTALAKNKNYNKPHIAYYYIGRIHQTQKTKKTLKLAEKFFKKSISYKPKHIDSVVALAQVYMKTDQTQAALKLLHSFQDKFGPSQKMAHLLSRHYLENEQYQKALIQFGYLEEFSPDDFNIKVRMALILIEQKKYQPAIEKLEEVLVVAPDSDKIRFYLAAVYEEVKDYDQAIEHFYKISSTSNYYPEAVIHIAYLLKKRANIEKAIEVVKKGIKNRSDVVQLYAFYASLLETKKSYKTAIVMLKGAVKRFPKSTKLLFFLGSMHDRIGQKKNTIMNMKKVIALDESHTQALNYLAYTYADLGQNLQEAEKLANKALSQQPHDSYILDTVGWVLLKQGRIEESIRYLEAAYKGKSNESIIAEHLGDAYYKFQLVDKAKSMYIKALSVENDKKKIKELENKIVSIEKQQNKKSRTPTSIRTTELDSEGSNK